MKLTPCPKCDLAEFPSPKHRGAHIRHCGKRVVAHVESQNGAISTELFSIVSGDIHLRGCEFGTGFLVLDGDTVQSYHSLGEAIADAKQRKEQP